MIPLVKRFLLLFFLIEIFFIATKNLSAQVYGLQFHSHDVILDERTGLNLSPDGFLSFQEEFELSFDYKLDRRQINSVFGYVFRIVSSNNCNIDLISTASPNAQLNLVVGKTNTIIPIKISNVEMKKWISLRIKFLLNEDKLIFCANDTSYVHWNLGFKRQKYYKIIFGSNDLQQFKTTDVPPMAIKDVRIYEKGQLKLDWPLNEESGEIVYDRVKKHAATVKNPSWLLYSHKIWQAQLKQELSEIVLVAADTRNDKIFMIGTDHLFIFSTESNTFQKIAYKNKPLFLTSKHRAIFNNSDKKIYCYLVNEKPFYVLDARSAEWNESGVFTEYRNKYLHHNNCYYSSDNSIYIFGGYGRLHYNNEIKKINLRNKDWTNLPSDDSIFFPRYLAGLGYLNDTIYILGGYGSTTGDQLINPHSYYDLFGYSIKDSSVFRKFEIPTIIDNMCIANSIWIDSGSRNYFALGFEKSKFDGSLQLIQGNLESTIIEKVGNRIPYQFLDIRSFSELFYMPHQNKLYAYTSYITDSTTTKIGIYSINFPPNKSGEVTAVNRRGKSFIIIYFVLAFVLLSLLSLYYFFKVRKVKESDNTNLNADLLDIKSSDEDLRSGLQMPKHQLIFFGGFQVFNKNHDDITNKFSPLLKELFLLILLHTFKNGKGISSGKLLEILWFEKSEKSARNNRAVNIARLRVLLEEMGNCELTKDTGYWKIVLKKSEFKSDYLDFLYLTCSRKNLTVENINQLHEITKKGQFLQNIHVSWLDDFKSEISDIIIDTFIEFAKSCDIRNYANVIIHLTDNIFNFDSINEEAMILKCNALYSLGKHTLAKTTYDNYAKEYRLLYDQEFDKSFFDIIKHGFSR